MKKVTRYRLIEFFELIANSVLPIIFWVSVIFGFDAPYVAILTIIAALVHEAGHLAAIRIFSGKNARLRAHASGFRINQGKATSYLAEAAVVLSGPCVNILIYLLSLLFANALDGYVKILGYINLATGVSNLLPIEGYDGYRAICVLLTKSNRSDWIRLLDVFSFSVCVLISFASLHLIDKLGEGYWIFGLFFFTMLSKLSFLVKYDIFGE